MPPGHRRFDPSNGSTSVVPLAGCPVTAASAAAPCRRRRHELVVIDLLVDDDLVALGEVQRGHGPVEPRGRLDLARGDDLDDLLLERVDAGDDRLGAFRLRRLDGGGVGGAGGCREAGVLSPQTVDLGLQGGDIAVVIRLGVAETDLLRLDAGVIDLDALVQGPDDRVLAGARELHLNDGGPEFGHGPRTRLSPGGSGRAGSDGVEGLEDPEEPVLADAGAVENRRRAHDVVVVDVALRLGGGVSQVGRGAQQCVVPLLGGGGVALGGTGHHQGGGVGGVDVGHFSIPFFGVRSVGATLAPTQSTCSVVGLVAHCCCNRAVVRCSHDISVPARGTEMSREAARV